MSQPTPPPAVRFGDSFACDSQKWFDPIAYKIKHKTNGPFIHTATCISPDTVTEATFKGGLHATPLADFLAHHEHLVLLRPVNPLGFDVTFSPFQVMVGTDFFEQEKGKKYDYMALASFWLGLGASGGNAWASDTMWFCSEWSSAWYAKVGMPLLNCLGTPSSTSPTGVAVSFRLRPVWHSLSPKVAKLMPGLADVPCGRDPERIVRMSGLDPERKKATETFAAFPERPEIELSAGGFPPR
jgi:hypothetical protein